MQYGEFLHTVPRKTNGKNLEIEIK
jgi:hypothetical protein